MDKYLDACQCSLGRERCNCGLYAELITPVTLTLREPDHDAPMEMLGGLLLATVVVGVIAAAAVFA